MPPSRLVWSAVHLNKTGNGYYYRYTGSYLPLGDVESSCLPLSQCGITAGIQPRRFGEAPLTQQHNRFGLLRPCRSCSSLKHMERIAGFYPSFDSSRETAKDFLSCAATLAVQAPRPPLSNSVIIRPPPARLQITQHISCRPLHAPPPPLLLLRSLACVSDDGR